MQRFIILTVITAAMFTVMGCANTPPAKQRLAMSSSLLFDRHPGLTSASDIAYRNQWPTAASGALIRERIQFTDRVFDFQGRNFGRRQNYQRNFQSRRTGVIER